MRLILTFFLTLCGLAALAAPKFAIISGDDANTDLADLAVAVCSGDYEFVDRATLRELEQEQRLQTEFSVAAGITRGALDGADFFAVIRTVDPETRLISVFETDCGIRLETVELPKDNEAALTLIRQTLGRAVVKTAAPEKLLFVSLAAVRNNLPPRYYKKQNQENKLRLRACALPAVMLEREYLIELLRERRLTGKWSRAAAAAEILHFELNPGKNPGEIEIAAFFTDLNDNIVFNCRIDAGDPKRLDHLFQQLAGHLASTPNDTACDLKTEARRFAREAELANGSSFLLSKTKRYFAAFALDDGNEEYLRGIFNINYHDFSDFYPYWKAAMEYVLEKPEPPNENIGNLFEQNLENVRDLFYQLTPELQLDHREFLLKYREKLLSPPPDAPAYPLNREIIRFRRIRRRLILNRAECAKTKDAAWNDILDKLSTPPPAASADGGWREMLTDYIWSAVPAIYELQDLLPHAELPDWTERSCRRIADTGIPELSPLIPLIRANALFYSKDFSRDEYLARLNEYFTLSIRLKSGWYSPNDQKIGKYGGLRKDISDLQLKLKAAAAQKSAVAAAAPQPERELMNRLIELKIKERRLGVYADRELKEPLALSSDGFDFIIKNIDSGKVLAAFPHSADNDPALNWHIQWKIYADDRYFVVAAYDQIQVGRRDNEVVMRRIPLHAQTIIRAWMRGDRLFAAANDALYSMDVDGGNLTIHFSAGMEDKALGVQKNSPKFYVFFAAAGKGPADVVLVFRDAGSSRMEIWNYNTETGEERKILRLSGPLNNCHMLTQVGGSLFFSSAAQQEWKHYQYRIDDEAFIESGR
ncbi:MAG: hypothetical protein PHI85_11215 [Victivallaceae bacterium]|nr:hypothetical protein [Victivallaceae bacterium]